MRVLISIQSSPLDFFHSSVNVDWHTTLHIEKSCNVIYEFRFHEQLLSVILFMLVVAIVDDPWILPMPVSRVAEHCDKYVE